jgi:hypothetical protein
MNMEDIAKRLRAFWAEINKLEWVQGVKHPLTPPRIFKNLWGHDHDCTKTRARCQICGHAVSDDNKERHEIIFPCERTKCLCSEPYTFGLNSHIVCDVCDGMYRAIYINWTLKNRDYFKKFDDDVNKLRGSDGRRRMGLD